MLDGTLRLEDIAGRATRALRQWDTAATVSELDALPGGLSSFTASGGQRPDRPHQPVAVKGAPAPAPVMVAEPAGLVRFGLMLLPVGIPFSRLEASARCADALGFDSLWLFDHLDTPHAEPGSPALDVYEGWTAATALAARTEQIHVGHNVLCNSFRHPALLAKMAATLDVVSGGRAEIGIGWGSMPDELDRYGFGRESPRKRASRLGETLEILELMFSGERFDYAGRFYTLHDALGRPMPVRGRVPIQIGGLGPTLTLPLVARFADWWNCPANGIDRLEELRPLTGRARVAVQCLVGLAPSSKDRHSVAEQTRTRFAQVWGPGVTGTPDEVAATLSSYAALGAEQIIVQFHDYGRPETLQLFASEVVPAVRATQPHQRFGGDFRRQPTPPEGRQAT